MKNFLITKHNNLVTVKSIKPLNFSAPEWIFNLWIYNINDAELLINLKDFLLSKEKEIINQYNYTNDGGTGLGHNTVTSRYHRFNLFKYTNEQSVLNLKNLIIKQLKDFLETINFEVLDSDEFNPYINCWYNVMRPGEKINEHAHNLTNKSFYSGHFTVNCENSYTYYVCPYTKERLEFQNNIGEGIFFPSYLDHGTSIHQGKDLRISIAFDIYYNYSQVTDSIKDNVLKLFD